MTMTPVPDRSTFEAMYAGQAPVPDVPQRRGTGDARAEAGVEEGTARRLRRALEHRVHRAGTGRGPARPEGHQLQRRRAEGMVCVGEEGEMRDLFMQRST